jgi:predicted N-acetyltransferase YhbS
MQLPAIRAMTPADVEPVAEAFLHEDWGDRRLTLDFVSRHDRTRPFVAETDGEIVGSAITSLNGSVAWIGMIWVRTDWRRHGLGLALTQATIDAAESAGCRTLVLVATETGRPLYERLGFGVQSWYRILEAPGLSGEMADPSVRAFRPSDLTAMAALDAAATGEDRMHLLTVFATPKSARVVERDDGALGGFIVRTPWGGGATIAPRAEDAARILRARRVASGPGKSVRAGLLQENEAGLAHLTETGWTEAWRAPRLVRGDPVAWQPEAIWGQFSFALG